MSDHVLQRLLGSISSSSTVSGKPFKNQVRTAELFRALKNEYDYRIADFSIRDDKPGIALIESRRIFLGDVLQASLANLNINANFDSSDFSSLQFTTRFQPFNPEDIICEQRNCSPASACKINITQCKRYRDTRACISCLFRNPLNNRCIKEALDPLCEASRNQQNARYNAERVDCITRADASKQECDRLNAQTHRSCQIEAGFVGSACKSVKDSMNTREPGVPLAHASTKVQTSGTLSANFSNFRIEGDLERLKLDMSLVSDLKVAGDMSFKPGNINHSLAACITSWSTVFESRFAAKPEVRNLLSNFEEGQNTLTANWSGFGLTIDTTPSPLETIFVSNPQLLAKCGIGLTVAKVAEAMEGEDAEFYRGHMELEIQLLPTYIRLAPASIILGEKTYGAEAVLSATHLRYDITKK